MKIKPQNSADQYAKSIAVFELFMKKGVNLYQNVTIPAEVSKDGQMVKFIPRRQKKNLIKFMILKRRVRNIMRLIKVRNDKGQEQ